VLATEQGVYQTVEEAVGQLFPSAGATRTSRIRAAARVVEALDGALTDPEGLSERQLLRLANAIRDGFAEPLETAARHARPSVLDAQWTAMLPYLVESERFNAAASDDPEPAASRPRATRGRPRRVLRPRPHLVVRREISRDGYILRFSGKEATSSLLDEVLDEIERWFSPGR
jgi:ParB family chromosome partitioning protein